MERNPYSQSQSYLIYFLIYRKGESSIHIEGNLYSISEGDMVLLNPDELHVSTPKDNCYMEKIPADIVQQLGINENLNQCLSYAKENTLEAQVLLSCKIIELLAQLAKIVENSNKTNLYPTSSNQTVNQMIDYINRHYTEDITLDTLAERFHFSKYYISHLFKDYIGVSPYDYLIIRRLYICNDLIRGKHTIKEACFLVGFHNYSNFYRLYKKHLKITPRQFKEQLK